MDQHILARYNDTILHEAMRRYGIAPHQVQLLDSFESIIYEEVDWINHLARGGVSAARAIPSLSGELVETIEDGDGGQFLVTAFVKAKGQKPWARLVRAG